MEGNIYPKIQIQQEKNVLDQQVHYQDYWDVIKLIILFMQKQVCRFYE